MPLPAQTRGTCILYSMTDETSPATTTDDHNYLKIMQYNVNKRREVVDSILNDAQTKDYSLFLIQEQYRIKLTNSPPIHQSWTLIEPTTMGTTPPTRQSTSTTVSFPQRHASMYR